MTTTRASQPPLVSRALLLRFVSIVASSIGFYLPLAAVPMYAAAHGSPSAGGLANGALLVATVGGELATPRFVARVGYRWALAVGLVLLGAPALVLVGTASFPAILAVNVLRGVGFAITVTAGGALTAQLIPDSRRGEGLALVGLVGGVPSLVALPFGAWAAAHWGFGPVFALSAAAPLLAVATVPGLPGRMLDTRTHHGVGGSLRQGALMRPATVFAASAAAAGVVVTYLPLALAHHAAWVAPAALLAQPAAATTGRWIAGRLGDRGGQVRLLVPGLALSILGVVAMAATGSVLLVIAGATTFGTGFGVLQNASLSLMYARVPTEGFSAVSAIWNAGYDLGMAVGAAGVAMLVGAVGFSWAFVVTALVMVPALLVARRETENEPGQSVAAEADMSAVAAASTV
ncbi:MAG TPA: MFS transporter [Nocardioides sp.]|uniref:MFS transporter n=1 Tax=Nocardioides sp. TaxID=35761 RepID=UPI002E3721C1|nr:MFS transporter [Nocardioides sp.]HEX5088299.1 MFS transporter [Nocardioides sp.]